MGRLVNIHAYRTEITCQCAPLCVAVGGCLKRLTLRSVIECGKEKCLICLPYNEIWLFYSSADDKSWSLDKETADHAPRRRKNSPKGTSYIVFLGSLLSFESEKRGERQKNGQFASKVYVYLVLTHFFHIVDTIVCRLAPFARHRNLAFRTWY